jgi:CDP-glucose 4,6-dehydratase
MTAADTTFWTGRHAFVTGATGFVGSHVARFLVDKGAQVVCLQRDEARINSLDLFELRASVDVVHGSVEDLPLIQRILNEYEIDAVFHLAAQALVGAANRSPLSTFETNIRGTYMLLEACRLSPTVKRVVVASSDKAYGSHEELPYDEEHALKGIFPYDASKVCTDVLARSYAQNYAMPVAVTRFANIYGPGDLNTSRVIPGTIVSVLRDEAPVIRSDGSPVRDFVYADDAARGYLLTAERIDDVAGEAFNFGSGSPVRILDLVNEIILLAGRDEKLAAKVMLKSKIQSEIDAQFLSSTRARTRLGWIPEVDLEEGLRRSIEWYRQHLDGI